LDPWLQLANTPLLQLSPVSCKSTAGQGKLADQRLTFYQCATQPTEAGMRDLTVFSPVMS